MKKKALLRSWQQYNSLFGLNLKDPHIIFARDEFKIDWKNFRIKFLPMKNSSWINFDNQNLFLNPAWAVLVSENNGFSIIMGENNPFLEESNLLKDSNGRINVIPFC